MPCYDDRNENARSEAVQKAAFMEAALCSVMTALESQGKDPLKFIDFQEAGISKQDLTRWWTEHKAKDARRRG